MKDREQKNADELTLARMLRKVDELARFETTTEDTDPTSSIDGQEFDAEQREAFLLAHRCLQRLHAVDRRANETMRNRSPTPVESNRDEVPSVALDGSNQKRIGRFEIERELGRGGFGVVLLARDPHLERFVALKILKLEVLVAPDSRLRFEREAKSAAILGHPAIVPIYESGTVGPIHYIAFGYFPGVTLADWISSHKELIDAKLAARIVARLADAVQHAHSRGVVHRDLKPANVLVHVREPADLNAAEVANVSNAMNSETDIERFIDGLKISDFGLAKTCFVEDSELTRTGALIGTPAYMSPEQARGDTAAIGFASDIYALGVMLYELLTGQRPFQESGDLATMQAVVSQEPKSPVRIKPGIPFELNAICLKCLEKETSNRYSNAQSLADDLNCWLEGRPVKAKPSSAARRIARWCKNNPGVATVSSIAILSILLGTCLVTWQWLRAEHNLIEAIEQRNRVQQQIARVDATIDQMVSNLTERIKFLPQLRPFRVEMLEQALNVQQQLVQTHGWEDITAGTGLCNGLVRIADLQLKLGDPASARATIDDAREKANRLASLEAGNIELNAKISFVSGRIAKAESNYEEAQELLQNAIRGFQQLTDGRQLDTNLVVRLADSFHQLGILSDHIEQHEKAKQAFDASLNALDRLSSDQQREFAVLAQRSNSHSSLAIVSKKLGQIDIAESQYRHAISTIDVALRRSESHVMFHDLKGVALMNLGNLFLMQERIEEAVECYLPAADIFERLAKEFPGMFDYYERLSLAANGLGTSRIRLKNFDEAERDLQKAIWAAEQMKLLGVNDLNSIYSLATAQTNLSKLYLRQGMLPQARIAIESATIQKRQLVESDPQSVTYRASLGTTLANLANVQSKLGEVVAPIDNYREALDHYSVALQSRPLELGFQKNVAMINRDLVVLSFQAKEYDESILAAEAAVGQFPDEVPLRLAIASRLVNCIQSILDQPELKDRKLLLDRYRTATVKILDKAREQNESAVNEFMLREPNRVLSTR